MLEKIYQPAEIEARIHKDWEDAQAFKAGRTDRVKADPYCIVIPPPNVTGSLHMGHALNNTLQDILCRFHRMQGRDVLWQPGTDHAGIATQMIVERRLAERQMYRRDMTRAKFIDEVWAWKAQSGGTIVNQLKRLGASCDWSRERFTMDEGLSKAVLKVFVELANTPGPIPGRNLIYKDKRLVNWDPEFQSAVSDLEVEMVEHRGTFSWTDGAVDKEGNLVPFSPTALDKALAKDPGGHMYYFRYPLTGKTFDKTDPNTFIVVATTRPETMLGDTGVAVHPEDERYTALIGHTIDLPLVGRKIPIVADTYSDPEKGSGAVKITPAHDFNDWDVGKRCKLDVINILDAKAALNDAVPTAYRGLDRFAARRVVTTDLVAGGFVVKIEPHTQAVPRAERGNAVIEPWLTDQWYVDAATLAKPALDAVRAGRTKFVPEKYAEDYFRWLENIQPWCISRQIWWGHQIPAWYGPDQHIFVATDESSATAQARQHYGKTVALTRDPDVLDTWFSSALWPFSTLGWPDDTADLQRYYPTNALVTGADIIFFWVARMMMMGLHFMPDVPFRDVIINSLVLDEKGQKMSKTKGNVIDPLVVIDRFGADALRFTLAATAAQARNVRMSEKRVEGYRNFATKLWNAARFAEMNECVRQKGFDPRSVRETVNLWVAGETERAVSAVTAAIEAYKFNDAANAAYEFTWGTFCDWYLELSKPILAGDDHAATAETRAMTAWVLDQILKMLHPFMPFITEELWGRMVEVGVKREALLCLSHWPDVHGLQNAAADTEIGWLITLISEVRSVRSEMNVPAATKIDLMLMGADRATRDRIDHHGGTIERMARVADIGFAATAPKGSAQIVIGETTVCLPLDGVIDMDAERARLDKEIAGVAADMAKMDAKLHNPSFMSRAKPEAIEETLERKAELTVAMGKLQAAVKRVSG